MVNYTKKRSYKQESKQITFQEILVLIANRVACNPKQNGSNYIINCPAHDDKHASLSVKQSEDGKVLFYCFSGCTIEEICTSIGIQVKDLFHRNSAGASYG